MNRFPFVVLYVADITHNAIYPKVFPAQNLKKTKKSKKNSIPQKNLEYFGA
jgi:hypothetical protein